MPDIKNELAVVVSIVDPQSDDFLTFATDPEANEVTIYGSITDQGSDGFTFQAAELDALGRLLATGLNI